jgi:hypothetical protein
MPSIGDRFSALQSQLLSNARLLREEKSDGGMDGVWRGPVHDKTAYYDQNGDGVADVALFERTQDTGAWSYDGTTGRQGVTVRQLSVLDANGRIVDNFEQLHAHRRGNGQLETKELRGEQELIDVVGRTWHQDYLADGRRHSLMKWTSAKDDGQSNAVADLDEIRTDDQTFPK